MSIIIIIITSPNGRSVKSAMAAVEEDYCIPMAIFDSRTLTRTKLQRTASSWDSYLSSTILRHTGTKW